MGFSKVIPTSPESHLHALQYNRKGGSLSTPSGGGLDLVSHSVDGGSEVTTASVLRQ